MKLLLQILIFLVVKDAHSYPSFIGYRYNNCVTCHYNVNGNGPLSDYGRALFSQEIAARPFISQSLTDEELAALSGFVAGLEMPYWIRPSVKYRGLWFDTAPGGSNSRKKWIHMQRDFSLLLAADDNYRHIVSVTYGILARPTDYYGSGKVEKYVSREHYLRSYLTKDLAVSVGLMDKAYGIRHADHTAANKSRIGNGQDDQVHGALVHVSKKFWEVTGHYFVGNLLQIEPLRQKGFSLTGEYTLGENHRIGTSYMKFDSLTTQAERLAVHDRFKLPQAHGSSVMVEVGLNRTKTAAVAKAPLGNYIFAEGIYRITRGYHLLSQFDRYQAENSLNSPDTQKWTFGFLIFPFQRIETRLTAVQTKTFAPTFALKDSWMLQGQVHASF